MNVPILAFYLKQINTVIKTHCLLICETLKIWQVYFVTFWGEKQHNICSSTIYCLLSLNFMALLLSFYYNLTFIIRKYEKTLTTFIGVKHHS